MFRPCFRRLLSIDWMPVVLLVMAHRSAKLFFRRSRPCADLKLGHRTLFIIPSRFGALWLAATALLLLVAVQTASNTTLLLAFVMLGLMALAMVLTHDTLQGLTLRCDQPSPTFAGEPASYPLLLESPADRPRCSLHVQGHPRVVCDRIAAGYHAPVTALGGREPRLAVAPSCADRDHCAPWAVHLLGTLAAPAAPIDLAPASAGPVAQTKLARSRDGLEEWQDLGLCARVNVLPWWIGPALPGAGPCRPRSSTTLASLN